MRRLARVVAAAGLLGLTGGRVGAAPAWHQMLAPQFTVFSQLSETDTRAWANEFAQFIEALRGIIPTDVGALPPLTVVLFASPGEFAPYRPLGPDGQPADIAGFFSRRQDGAVIGLAHRENDPATRRVIFHEGVHWFMSGTADEYPLWLNEGLAEVFSTFQVEDGRARWGDPIPGHLAVLRTEAPLPLEKLVSITRADPLYYRRHSIGIYYAESWAFVHYLLFGSRPGSRVSVAYYMQALRTGTPPERAFEDAFGTSYSGMDDTLGDYVRTGRYSVATQALSPSAAITAEFTPAGPLAMEITLEKLAAGSGRRGPPQPR